MADPILSTHSISLSCAPGIENYVAELRSTFDFAQSVVGLPVYLDLEIKASDHSGHCEVFEDHARLTNAEPPEDHGIRHPYVTGTPDRLVAWARTTEFNAGTTSLTLPDVNTLPEDGLYKLKTSSNSFFRYAGLAVVRTFVSNGNDHVTVIPIQNSHLYWREILQVQ